MDHLVKHLPFWHFFHDLEKQLSYERWTDKYKLFLDQLYDGDYLTDGNDPGGEGASFNKTKLLVLCKALYLQDIRDEKRFEKMFDAAFQKEIDYLQTILQSLRQQQQAAKANEDKPVNKPDSSVLSKKTTRQPEQRNKTKTVIEETQTQTTQQKKTTKEYYYTPPEIKLPELLVPDTTTKPVSTAAFNFQDEYLPITRREMNKAWQYLRHGEAGTVTDVVNVPATVKRLAKEAIFTEPVFVSGKRNRQDTLIIFVDCMGSMAPFHELSRRLVISAKTFGGHRNAQVYYFQNNPSSYVFGRPNLTKPFKTVEAFAKANHQFTTAVIISDAGFARGYGSDTRFSNRINSLQPFFSLLSSHCARTLWLNPMPENRWHKPTAAGIQQYVLKMAPLLVGNGMNSFQNTIRNLLKKHPTPVSV
jgi:uncharacterized protein